MANQFVNLPALAANGAGAWIDVSSFGGLKTITVEPNGGVFSPFVTIEGSNQDTPTVGYPITLFQQVKDQTFEVACHWMRAVTSNYKGGGAPTVAVGGTTDGTSSAQLPVPTGNGLGAAVNVSALENLKTVQVVGAFGGTINILVSEDGGATYNGAYSFQGGGPTSFQTLIVVADFMRVERVGVPMVSPGQPTVWVSATAGGGGGGGGAGIDVQEEGVDVVNPASTLNFTGAGVTVTDAGGGVADIAIPGGAVTVDQDGTPVVDPASILNFTGAAVDVTDAGGGQADIDVGINISQDETPKVTRAKEINFAGDAPITVTVTDLGGGIANVVIGGSLSAAQHGLISFSGGEDPNNIPVALPVAMAGDYIVQALYWPADPAAGTVSPFLISQTDEQNFTLGLSDSPLAGDQLMWSTFLRT